MTTARPALDPQLQGLLSSTPEAPPLNEETLEIIRPYATLPVETALAGRTVDRQEISIASFDGTQIALTILSPARADPRHPGHHRDVDGWPHISGGCVVVLVRRTHDPATRKPSDIMTRPPIRRHRLAGSHTTPSATAAPEWPGGARRDKKEQGDR